MMTQATWVKKLYLMQLSLTTVTFQPGRTIEMSTGCYLIETVDGGHILIDSGMAQDAINERPAVTPESREVKNVLEHLTELNVSPREIDTVICTHFDIDHAGYHDHFVNAEFVVQRQHYRLAKDGHPRYAGARVHWDDPRLKYRLVEGDVQLLPGLELLETSGHCIGHQSVLVRLLRTGPVLLAVDAAVLQRTFTLERKATLKDENEELLIASTRKMMEVVEKENVKLVVFGHDGEQWPTLKKAPEFYE